MFTAGRAAYRLNGVSIAMDVAPYIRDGRMMVPLRYAAEALGMNGEGIAWDERDQCGALTKGSLSAIFTAGSTRLIARGVAVTMDVAPELVNGRLMLPACWVGLALNGYTYWDESAQEAIITSQW
ncbi:copper amine oxidase N-terminal domain-containing protein [Kyrpidia sp.]|uniref:copper amine oxidase N-terminal domain-containing protein n=1 Tax=Kyrpidia sp. TaxID=2073077 RepID=UPI002585E790|nr:copper amine oxidase N-terminal domain-containing protein [Kyrpidia sp.]